MVNEKSKEKLPTFLLTGSVILWVMSLLTTAIVYNGEILPGAFVLFVGILFGWLGLTFQAYTNITYIIALFKGFANKPSPKLTTITFLGGLSSFFLTKLLTPCEAQASFADIDAWGWGAIFWISAYALLLLHTIYLLNPEKHIKIVRAGVMLISAAWIIIFFIGNDQYRHANAEEKARVFKTISSREASKLLKSGSKLSIFIPFMSIKPAIARPLSGLPYTPLDENLLNEESIIEFKGNLTDRFEYDAKLDGFEIDLPDKYIHNDKFILQYGDIAIITDSKKQPDYTVTAKRDDELTVVTIYDEKKQSIVWQAPIKEVKRKYGYSHYPDYSFYRFFRPIEESHLVIETGKKITLAAVTVKQRESIEEDFDIYQLKLADTQKIWVNKQVEAYANSDYLVLIKENKLILIDRKTYAATQEMRLKIEWLGDSASNIMLEKIADNKQRQTFKVTFGSGISATVEE